MHCIKISSFCHEISVILIQCNLVATTTTLNSVLATLGELKGAVESLKARPATMWDKLIYAVIGAAGAAIITYLIGGRT